MLHRLVALALGAVATLTFTAAGPAAAATSSNGDLAYHAPTFGGFSDRHYDIFVQPEGGSPVNITADSGAWETEPDWSPDGTKILFTSNRGGWNEIYVMNADGSNVQQLTTGAGEYDESWGARWSPDGARIAYTHDPRMGSGGDTDIYTMKPDGSDKRNVTDPHEDLQYDDYSTNWSPDGTRLVFIGVRPGDGGGTLDIVTANPDGTDQRRLVGNMDHSRWVEYPSFSPDGQKILFMQASPSGGDWDVWVMNADGSGQENVTQHPAGDDYPTWSNDGTQIFFTSNRNSGSSSDLYVIDYPAPEPAAVASSSRTRRRTASTSQASAASVAPATRIMGNVQNPDFASVGEVAPPPPAADRTASLTDAGLRAAILRTKPGLLVRWTNTGTKAHSIRETAVGLFAAGLVAPGATYDHRFVGAGTFTLRDITTGSKQTIEVVMSAVRRLKGDGRTVALRWGSQTLDGERVYDVQVRKPGAATFGLWRSTTAPAGDYTAAKAGAHEFRTRLRSPGSGASAWAPVRTVDVP